MDKNLADDTHARGVGTAGSSVTAAEYGDGQNHVTKLTISGLAVTIGDNASLAIGSLIYTLPAGDIIVHGAGGSVQLALDTGTPTTDTPEVGLGTTIGAEANATLGAVDAAAENIAGPHVMNNVAGTAEPINSVTAGVLHIPAAGDHTIYLNFADAWANVSDDAATVTAELWIAWTLLEDAA